jgi:hypothetical protein
MERLNNNPTQANNMHDSSAANSGQDMVYNNLSGNDFDRKWISETELGKTQNTDLKNLITKSLHTISEHLRQLEALRNK